MSEYGKRLGTFQSPCIFSAGHVSTSERTPSRKRSGRFMIHNNASRAISFPVDNLAFGNTQSGVPGGQETKRPLDTQVFRQEISSGSSLLAMQLSTSILMYLLTRLSGA